MSSSLIPSNGSVDEGFGSGSDVGSDVGAGVGSGYCVGSVFDVCSGSGVVSCRGF